VYVHGIWPGVGSLGYGGDKCGQMVRGSVSMVRERGYMGGMRGMVWDRGCMVVWTGVWSDWDRSGPFACHILAIWDHFWAILGHGSHETPQKGGTGAI
jgi:hypothetical protein